MRLPSEGPGFLRRARGQHYGTSETITLIEFVAARLKEAYPGSAPLLIGDISRREGGYLPPHRSHQSGRDVDIAIPERANTLLRGFKAELAPADVDVEKLWFILETLITSHRVQFVFLDRALHSALREEAHLSGWSAPEITRLLGNGQGKRGLVRHAPGHRTHAHIRFRCPQGSSGCVP